MPKKTVLLPRGGLGNQLHQFVLAYQLCQSINQAMAIDARHLPSKAYESRTGVTLRPFALENFVNFRIPVRYSRSRLEHYYFRVKLEVERYLLNRFPPLSKSVVTLDEISQEDFWASRPKRITSLLRKLEVSDEILESAREIFDRPKNPTKYYGEIKKIVSQENIVGVHVRRGDYIKLGHVYGEISLKWYLDGIESIVRENQRVFVFSDSSSGFEELIGKLGEERVQIIGPEKIPDPFEVLNLLSSCSSLVLSNSTLSWWSIALGVRFDKVLYPSLASHLVQVFDEEKLQGLVHAEFISREIY